MYISEEELKERLEKTDVFFRKRERVVRKSVKTGEGESRLSHEDRKIIGILEDTDTQKNIAELLGVSQMTVSNASRGLTSPTIGLDKELRDEVAEGRAAIAESKIKTEKQIQEQLVSNLASALGHVANNLHNTDAVEASKVASDMSKILERISGDKEHKGNKTAIIINVPSMREEKHYQTISV